MRTTRFALLLLGLAAGVACAADVQIYVLSNQTIEADTSDRSLEQKVVFNKPADAVDRCTVPGTGIAGPCVIPQSGSPRLGAGEPLTDDTAKCQLKAMNRTGYFPILFSDAQWSQLQQAFPTGVCDYTKAGVSQQATLPWMTYQNGPGGQPLGNAPVSEPFCCTQTKKPKH